MGVRWGWSATTPTDFYLEKVDFIFIFPPGFSCKIMRPKKSPSKTVTWNEGSKNAHLIIIIMSSLSFSGTFHFCLWIQQTLLLNLKFVDDRLCTGWKAMHQEWCPLTVTLMLHKCNNVASKNINTLLLSCRIWCSDQSSVVVQHASSCRSSSCSTSHLQHVSKNWGLSGMSIIQINNKFSSNI